MSNYKQLKQLTINTEKWARGGKKGDAKLLNNDGNMCCLGFLGKACGIKKEFLEGVLIPDEVLLKDNFLKYPILNLYEITWSNFASINDSFSFTEKARRIKLKEMFKKYLNIKLIFK